jgi:pimeloyl-ACP methyl ester carboxylesterase
MDLYAPLDNFRIHYRSAGSGPTTLIFVHGWGCDLNLWRLQAEALAPHARLLLMDQPGHGSSDAPDIPYTIDMLVRAVGAVLDHAGVEQAVPVGHSLGGMVAYEFARRHPARCPALIWVDGTFAIPAQIDEQIAANQQRAAGCRAPDGRQFIAEFVEGLFTPATPAAVRQEITATIQGTPVHVLAACMEGIASRSLYAPSRLDIPVLAIFCRFWKPEPWLSLFRDYLPQIEMQLLDECGHYPMLEEPEVVNQALLSFLRQNRL